MKSLSAVLLLLIFFYSCKKDTFITTPDAQLLISADTLHFDTVFTSTGSITGLFKIFNPNNQKIKIDHVTIRGGSSSAFKINADGFSGPDVKNLNINPGDSLYVFVSVFINPTSAGLPFIVTDSIEIAYNGNKRLVQLQAFGQNANFLRGHVVAGTETWNSNLPYVILDGLLVPQNAVLQLEKGTKVYVHADAPWIIDGTLKINGGKDSVDRVYFQGDRLDEPYRNYPAAWPGIFFRNTSKDNQLSYAVINNAYQAIAISGPSINSNPKLKLEQCIINNAYDAGIIAVNSDITAVNCLVSNCGKNIYLVQGGQYNFNHCTVASFSNPFILHKDPVLYVSNFTRTNNTITTNPLQATFSNSIFWGDFGLVEDEVVVAKNGTANFNVSFDHVLMKVKNDLAAASLNQVIKEPPLFDSINTSKQNYNLRLKAGSPAINKGKSSGIMIDLDGRPRPVGLPDLGAYEKQ